MAGEWLVRMCTFIIMLETCYGQGAEKDINICDVQSGTTTRLARVSSPGYPASTSTRRVCRCHLNNTLMSVKSSLFLTVGDDRTLPVVITYMAESMQYTWPIDYTASVRVDEGSGKVIVATNVSTVWITMDTRSTNYSQTLFRIDVEIMDRYDQNSLLRVSCVEVSSNDTTLPTTTTSNNGKDTLQSIADMCSPHLIIILAALSVVFLLIILVVSIILCCIVPRKRQELLVELRKSRFMVEEIKRSSNGMFLDVPRSDAIIYDEAGIKLVGGNEPVGYRIPSQCHYANADGIQP